MRMSLALGSCSMKTALAQILPSEITLTYRVRFKVVFKITAQQYFVP